MAQPQMMMGPNGQPIVVMNKNQKRDQGNKAQASNILAGRSVANIVRTTLGPKAMLKMLLDPMGGIVLTNDGNAILREVDVGHPAAKNLIEIARAQDEEVGDGTTSVIILTGEMLGVAEPLLDKKIHPTKIVGGYMAALTDAVNFMEEIAIPIDAEDESKLRSIVQTSIDTKFVSRYGSLISDLAVTSALTVREKMPDGRVEIDLKRYAKIEKLAGGEMSECEVLSGVMFNKDVTHGRMKRKMKNPRVVLLDCPLEYKKGESSTNVEVTKEEDWEKLLMQEEEEVKKMCDEILRVKPDVVITEKGVSDLAQHFLMKGNNCSVIRRIRKTDNNRVAKVTGATIVNRPEELTEEDVGTQCGLFEIKKYGDEYYTFMTECKDPKACTIMLRGASRDVLNEIERNLHDAFAVARNILLHPKLVPGGGAVEMYLSQRLKEKSKTLASSYQYPYAAVAAALEVIPRSLAHNSGADVVRTMTDLRSRMATLVRKAEELTAQFNAEAAKDAEAPTAAPLTKSGEIDTAFWQSQGARQAYLAAESRKKDICIKVGAALKGEPVFGLDGNNGKVAAVQGMGIVDTFAVKVQTLKTAIETAAMLLRIDDIVSGTTSGQRGPQKPKGAEEEAVHGADGETFGDARDG